MSSAYNLTATRYLLPTASGNLETYLIPLFIPFKLLVLLLLPPPQLPPTIAPDPEPPTSTSLFCISRSSGAAWRNSSVRIRICICTYDWICVWLISMVVNACMRALYYAYMCIVVASVLTCPAVYIPSLGYIQTGTFVPVYVLLVLGQKLRKWNRKRNDFSHSHFSTHIHLQIIWHICLL